MELDLKNFRVKLSKNSFHYKFMKFILGKLMPDLYTLCPYFWLLIACFILSPIVVPIRLLVLGIEFLFELLDKYIFIPKWYKFMETVKLEDYYLGEDNKLKTPFCFKRPFEGDYCYFENYIRSKYNLSVEEYWLKVKESRELHQNNLNTKYKERLEEENKRKSIRIARKEKFINFFTIKKLNIASIIKWTKRTLSLIFTVCLIIGIYYLSKYLLSLKGHIDWNAVWSAIKYILFVISIALTVVGSIFGIVLLIIKLKDKCEEAGYTNKFLNSIGSFFKFIWNCLCFICNIITSPFVFCYKYFKATKDDYCPEIIWDDDTTDSK